MPLPDPINDLNAVYAEAPIYDPTLSDLTITVSGISAINQASWRVPIAH